MASLVIEVYLPKYEKEIRWCRNRILDIFSFIGVGFRGGKNMERTHFPDRYSILCLEIVGMGSFRSNRKA
jgi:hypothetical protein